jgi:hypothetical protein
LPKVGLVCRSLQRLHTPNAWPLACVGNTRHAVKALPEKPPPVEKDSAFALALAWQAVMKRSLHSGEPQDAPDNSASALAAENASPPPWEKAEEEAEAAASHSPKVGLRRLPRLQSSTYAEASADAEEPVCLQQQSTGGQLQRRLKAT